VHDTIDVNFLKRVKNKNRDSTYKAEVWDVSQNVDRQAFPADGLTSCLTPRYRSTVCLPVLLCTIFYVFPKLMLSTNIFIFFLVEYLF